MIVHCPNCSVHVTKVDGFLLQQSFVYCKACGWNVKEASATLRSEIWASWPVAGFGVWLAAMGLKGPWGISGSMAILLPFVLLPIGSALMSRYRLSKLPVTEKDSHQSLAQ